jgi:hypothetical protein
MELAPSDSPPPSAGRFGAAIGELQALLQRLERTAAKRRPLVFAECIPLLQEVSGLNQPPLPGKEIKALIHEAGWHMRSLAGLAMAGGGTSEDHRSWAEQSLAGLAAWSARHPSV